MCEISHPRTLSDMIIDLDELFVTPHVAKVSFGVVKSRRYFVNLPMSAVLKTNRSENSLHP
jgi:hypothetical protein